jgi:hypothetical protein
MPWSTLQNWSGRRRARTHRQQAAASVGFYIVPVPAKLLDRENRLPGLL